MDCSTVHLQSFGRKSIRTSVDLFLGKFDSFRVRVDAADGRKLAKSNARKRELELITFGESTQTSANSSAKGYQMTSVWSHRNSLTLSSIKAIYNWSVSRETIKISHPKRCQVVQIFCYSECLGWPLSTKYAKMGQRCWIDNHKMTLFTGHRQVISCGHIRPQNWMTKNLNCKCLDVHARRLMRRGREKKIHWIEFDDVKRLIAVLDTNVTPSIDVGGLEQMKIDICWSDSMKCGRDLEQWKVQGRLNLLTGPYQTLCPFLCSCCFFLGAGRWFMWTPVSIHNIQS